MRATTATCWETLCFQSRLFYIASFDLVRQSGVELPADNTFVSQVVSAAIGGLVTWLVVRYISARQRVKAVNKLERLEAKLERFLELEKDHIHAHLTLTKELVFTLRLATYFLVAILAIQLIVGGNARHLFIGASIGILTAVSNDLTEIVQFARGLLEPEAYKRELEKRIKRHERLELNG